MTSRSPSPSTFIRVTDPNDDINEALDATRKAERVERDESVEAEIDSTERIADTMAEDERD